MKITSFPRGNIRRIGHKAILLQNTNNWIGKRKPFAPRSKAAAVTIKQKVVKWRPIDKLLDAFIMMLAGGRGLVEVNTRVRPDWLLQAAFGRDGCADQSTVRATLNACTSENVAQLRQGLRDILRQHSRA